MRYGSLCSGVGGLDLAVEAVFGAEVAWHAEVDKEACKVLAKHWPGVMNYGDITRVAWDEVSTVDLLCAGPPCQPVSLVGPITGHNDERFLWDEVLMAVEALRPGWVVLENPPGIRPWLPAIFYRLAQMGYLGCYGAFSAAAIGACHRRERYFVLVAHPDRARYHRDWGQLPEEEEPRWGQTDLGDELESAPHGLPIAYGRALRRHAAILGHPAPPPLAGRHLNPEFLTWMMMLPEGWTSIATPHAQRRLLGNAVVPLCAEAALRGLLARLGPQLGS